jgi:hypothetical protein
MDNGNDFLSQYLAYIGETEAPIFYHRWCCISMIGAYLGRGYSFKLGHFELYPNLYCMLIGSPGARKSTAIKIAKKIITAAGYEKISADRSTKEKFLLDLAGEELGDEPAGKVTERMLDTNLWGDTFKPPAEMYIACDEFNDFIGNGNVEFISMLGNLWDWTGPPYENRVKNGKSVSIHDPTISILGGNTPISFSRAFPPEVLGQGFFSRLLLIHGEPTGRKITFPEAPSAEKTGDLIQSLQQIKSKVIGQVEMNSASKKLLDKIYKGWKGIDDVRFESYANRRFNHLIKLCLITSASSYRSTFTEDDIIYANTILSHTEHLMPKAMGEFGKSRNSDVSHKILQVIESASKPLTLKDLWKHVNKDVEKPADLGTLLQGLQLAEKIQTVNGGFLPKRKILEISDDGTVNYELLTEEERNMSR